MEMQKKGALALFGLMLATTAQADEPWQTTATLGGSAQYTDMRESINGSTVVRETGWLPGALGRLTLSHEDLELGAELHGYTGALDYDGETQSGLPFRTRTDTGYAGTEFGIAWKTQGFRFRYFLGYEYWQRDVRGSGNVGGADETYAWWRQGLGADYRLVLNPQWSLTPGLSAWYSYGVRQDARSGNLDTSHLRPGSAPGVRIDLPLSTHFQQGLELTLRPYAQVFHFGRSPNVPASANGMLTGTSLYQPEIQYRQVGMNLEWSQRF